MNANGDFSKPIDRSSIPSDNSTTRSPTQRRGSFGSHSVSPFDGKASDPKIKELIKELEKTKDQMAVLEGNILDQEFIDTCQPIKAAMQAKIAPFSNHSEAKRLNEAFEIAFNQLEIAKLRVRDWKEIK